MADQIVVNESVIPSAITSGIRQALLFLGGLAVGKGWLSNDALLQVVPIVIALVTFAYGQYRNWRVHKERVITADASPDPVAVVK